MFKVECMVEDKNLPKVLRLLASSSAYNVLPTPASGAKVKGGTAVSDGSGGAIGAVKNSLFGDGRKGTARFKKGDQIPLVEIAAILTGNGLSASSARYVANKLVAEKILRAGRSKKGQRKMYEVLK